MQDSGGSEMRLHVSSFSIRLAGAVAVRAIGAGAVTEESHAGTITEERHSAANGTSGSATVGPLRFEPGGRAPHGRSPRVPRDTREESGPARVNGAPRDEVSARQGRRPATRVHVGRRRPPEGLGATRTGPATRCSEGPARAGPGRRDWRRDGGRN